MGVLEREGVWRERKGETETESIRESDLVLEGVVVVEVLAEEVLDARADLARHAHSPRVVAVPHLPRVAIVQQQQCPGEVLTGFRPARISGKAVGKTQ